MCKKNLLFLTIIFAGTSFLAGCGKSSGSSVNKPLNVFNIDNYIKFGKETYRPRNTNDSFDHKNPDKLIGYIINQDDSETFEREDGYIYGLVANFYVYNYEENYLPVYSLDDVDYKDCIAIQAGEWVFFEYINIGTNEEISLKI